MPALPRPPLDSAPRPLRSLRVCSAVLLPLPLLLPLLLLLLCCSAAERRRWQLAQGALMLPFGRLPWGCCCCCCCCAEPTRERLQEQRPQIGQHERVMQIGLQVKQQGLGLALVRCVGHAAAAAGAVYWAIARPNAAMQVQRLQRFCCQWGASLACRRAWLVGVLSLCAVLAGRWHLLSRCCSSGELAEVAQVREQEPAPEKVCRGRPAVLDEQQTGAT